MPSDTMPTTADAEDTPSMTRLCGSAYIGGGWGDSGELCGVKMLAEIGEMLWEV